MFPPPPTSPPFPYTTLFRSRRRLPARGDLGDIGGVRRLGMREGCAERHADADVAEIAVQQQPPDRDFRHIGIGRSEEHTSELQSHVNLVCRLLLEKKKKTPLATQRVYEGALELDGPTRTSLPHCPGGHDGA